MLRKVAPFPFPPGWKPMPPPIKYYVGKQRMWLQIMPLVPYHEARKEPFLGGCTSLALPATKIEIWNDKSGFVVNFYETAKLWEKDLTKRISTALNSEYQYKEAHQLYRECEQTISKLTKSKRIEMAWAFFVLCNLSFAGDWSGGYQFSCTEKMKNRIQRKKRIEAFCKRIEEVQLLCRDGIDVITSGDNENVFVYLDPPYVGAKQGHYKGYTIQNFTQLLNALSNMKGMFLLSSYPSETLSRYVRKQRWNYQEISINCDASNGKKMKLECLTWNYDIEKIFQQGSLF